MCPMCWASLFASCAAVLAPPTALLAIKDWLAVVLASVLATLAGVHLAGWTPIGWWLLAGTAGLLVARVAWLGACRRQRLASLTVQSVLRRHSATASDCCQKQATPSALVSLETPR